MMQIDISPQLVQNALQPVWHDDDDPLVPVHRPKWAMLPEELPTTRTGKRLRDGELDGDSESEDGHEDFEIDQTDTTGAEAALQLLRSTEKLLGSKGASSHDLPQRCLKTIPQRKQLASLEFHPYEDILATLNYGELEIWKMDDLRRHYKSYPILESATTLLARFSNCGSEIIVMERPSKGIVVDVASGAITKFHCKKPPMERNVKMVRFLVNPVHRLAALLKSDGGIDVISTQTWLTVGSMHMSGATLGGAFDPQDPYTLFTCGNDRVYTWDLRNLQPVDTWRDHSLVSATSIALAKGQVAVGTEAGFVNVYQRSVFQADLANITAIRSLPNLTMPVSTVRYHPSGELLAMLSARHRGQLRIVHTPSMRVIPNFPPLGGGENTYTHVDFSGTGRHLALGTAGAVQVYELTSY